MQVALPQAEIYNRLTGLGWDAQIDLKNGIYIAKGEGPNGQPPIERVGQTADGALAALLMFAVRSTQIRQFVSRRTALGGWSRGFEDKLKEIGSAYSKLRVFDQKAVPAWRALATESGKQADAIRAQIKVEETDSPEPYDSLREMVQDVHHDKKFLVSRAHANHPVWSKEDVVNFRIVHEVLGHVQSGGDFSWVGENMATALHMPLVTPLAREALFVEVIGQAAYQNLYHGYGPQKIGFMSEFLHPVQGDEGEHVAVPHGGIPDLGGMAAVMNSEDAYGWTQTPQGDWKQVADKNKQSEPKISADVAPHVIGADPNKNWETPPEFVSPAVGAGQEGDYIDQIGAFDNAAKIDTEWWEKDPATQDKAIMNALRVAILSPQKNLRWNCHDETTEALTSQGWMGLDDLTSGGTDLRVAAFVEGQIVYEQPTDFALQYYQGEMMAFKGRYIDALVTPNHRMLTTGGEFLTAEQIANGAGKTCNGRYGPFVPTAANSGSTNRIEEFTVPGVLKREVATRGPVNAKTIRPVHPDITMSMDTWLEWLGWYVSEGWLSQRGHPKLSQSLKSADIAACKQSCFALGMGTERIQENGMWEWAIKAPHAKSLGRWLSWNVGDGARNKRLPEFVFSLPPSQAQLLLNSLLMGDGTAMGKHGHVYYTSSLRLADDVQRLAVHCGYRAPRCPGPKAKKDTHADQWVVRINPGNPTRLPVPERQSYRGWIWCFTMPSGTLITRRNGKVTISGNSAHYQAIKDMPFDATAPDMWHKLEQERNSHNDKLGVPILAHAQVSTQIAFLADELEKADPSLTRAEARRQAKQTFYDTIKAFEEQLYMDADEADEQTPMRRHIEARKLAVEYLQERYTPAKGWQPGQTVLAAEDTLFDPGQTEVANDATGFAAPDAKYGAFQAAHLEGIEDASKHIDQIRAAALKDIHETGGLGHDFRHTLLNLNIRGISAKVASFAWLLLRPLTSDLGIIDTHMARGLGVQASGNSVPLRDYYKAERMQRAAKDASGYGHLPLGVYHWGLWDTVRSGPGSHSDHSTLRVLDPEPHNEEYWPPASNAKQEFVGPPEFERVRPAMSAVGHQFDQELGHLPQGEIPDIRKAILPQPDAPNPNMHMTTGKTATDDWGAFDEEQPAEFANVNWQNMDWGDELGDDLRQKYWNNRQPWIFYDGVLYLGHEGEYHGDLARSFSALEDVASDYRNLPVGHKVGDEVYALNEKGKQVEEEVRRRIANGEYHEPGYEDLDDHDPAHRLLETYEDYPPPDHSGF